MLLISCKGKIGDTDLDYFSNLNFSLDTVIIDPGDEIVFLKYQLSNSDISKDGKYLLNFNKDDHTVEKINLDELRLEEKHSFEKEGPNGTGSYVGKLLAYNENQIILTGMGRRELFSLDGQKLNSIHFKDFSLDGEPMSDGELRLVRGLDTDTNRLYGIIYSDFDKSYTLGILNLEDFKVSKLKLKSFEKLSDYEIMFSSNGIQIYYPPNIDLDCFGTKVILSNEITNSLTWYDTEKDSLFIRSYDSQLTANHKEKDYKREHGTFEELEAEQRRLKEEINFLPPLWDPDNQIFYRFSYQELAVENRGGESMKSKVYLTVLDKNLNQIGESLVPQLTKEPGKHFVKDGKIWIYENMDDEMGFIRLEMDE